jgi:hypothetical protein
MNSSGVLYERRRGGFSFANEEAGMTTFPKAAVVAIATTLFASSEGLAATVEIDFDAGNFSNPLTIDNQYWPLIPGTTFIYKAKTPDGCEEDHFTVTSDTKLITINGENVTTRVIEDLAYEDEECNGVDDSEVVEKTVDWHAQDNAGNVWYFGEETYDCNGLNNCVLGDGSWEAGKDIQNIGSIALPGIIILANGTTGDAYRQELYEGFAEDWAKIMGKNATVTLRRDDAIDPGSWSNCLVTKEWNGLDSGSVEQKYYCAGIGLVLVTEHSGKVVRFELTGVSGARRDAFKFRKVPRQ